MVTAEAIGQTPVLRLRKMRRQRGKGSRGPRKHMDSSIWDDCKKRRHIWDNPWWKHHGKRHLWSHMGWANDVMTASTSGESLMTEPSFLQTGTHLNFPSWASLTASFPVKISPMRVGSLTDTHLNFPSWANLTVSFPMRVGSLPYCSKLHHELFTQWYRASTHGFIEWIFD